MRKGKGKERFHRVLREKINRSEGRYTPQIVKGLIFKWNNFINRADERMDAEVLKRIYAHCEFMLGVPILDFAGLKGPMLGLMGNARLAIAHIEHNVSECEKALSIFQNAISLLKVEERLLAATISSEMGNAVFLMGKLTQDRQLYVQGTRYFDQALSALTKKTQFSEWSKAAEGKALCLCHLGELNGDGKTVAAATRSLQAVIKEQIARNKVDQKTVANLVAALFIDARMATSEKNFRQLHRILKKKITELHADKDNRIKRRSTLLFTHYYVAVCQKLGLETKDVTIMRDGLQVCENVMQWLCKNSYPIDWSKLCHLRGNIMDAIAQQECDIGLAIKAINVLSSARRIFSSYGVSAQWARISFDIGLIKYRLSHKTGGNIKTYDFETDIGMALRVLSPLASPELSIRGIEILAVSKFRRRQYKQALVLFFQFEKALKIILIDPQVTNSSRKSILGKVGSYYYMAAFCSYAKGAYARAIEILDRGRSILHNDLQWLDMEGGEIPDINHASDVELARSNFLSARARFLAFDKTGNMEGTVSKLIGEMEKAWETYAACYRKVGFGHFGTTNHFNEVISRMPDNLVFAYLFFTDVGGAALIATREMFLQNCVRTVAYDGGLFRELVSLLATPDGKGYGGQWFMAYDELVAQIEKGEAIDRLRAPDACWSEWHPVYRTWNEHLEKALNYCWKYIMEPLQGELAALDLKREAELVLFSPGSLSNLPLAAAGCRENGRWHCFFDSWTVTSAPNMTAVARSYSRKSNDTQYLGSGKRSMAIVSAGTDHETEINEPDFFQEEAVYLCNRHKKAAVSVLNSTTMSIAEVVSHCSSATFFHASTHGTHSWVRPETSGIEIWPDFNLPIKLLDAQGMVFKNCRLVFLSACSSGLSDIRYAPTENIGLASSFLKAGASVVISVLWPVFDDAAYLLVVKFYENYLGTELQEKMSPIRALRDAQCWLRDVTFGELADTFGIVEHKGEPWICLPVAPVNLQRDYSATYISRPMLRMGLPETRPFSMPHEWAGYVAMGI